METYKLPDGRTLRIPDDYDPQKRALVAAEIKRTSKAYKEGRYIDLKAVQKSRATKKRKRK